MTATFKQLLTVFLVFTITFGMVFAEEDEVLTLKGMSVIGNQELPKSLMVIPWKHSELGELHGYSMDSLLDSGITHVDQDVFKRKIEYYQLRTDEPLLAE